MECYFQQTRKYWITDNKGKRFVYEFERRMLNGKVAKYDNAIYVFGKMGNGGIADKLYRKYPKIEYIGFDNQWSLRKDFI